MWKIPQARAVDGVRWLPTSAAAWDRMLLCAFFDPDTGASGVDLSALCFSDDMEHEEQPQLDLRAHWSQPDRISSLAAAAFHGEKSLLATASALGTLRLTIVDAAQFSLASSMVASDDFLLSVNLHHGAVAGVDVQADTGDCLTVGEDGKINLVKLSGSELNPRLVYDSRGLLSFSDVHWASPTECVTAGVGSPLQWWDLRQPSARPASQCRLKWDGLKPGFIHSIDVHPSRKHLCVVGGSAGSVFAWDLRWKQEAVKLQIGNPAVVESEIWEVKYDHYMPSDSGKFPPVMVCSEDGVLALVDGENVTELLVEPCSINSFDIDPENGRDIVCGLEYESLLFLRRKRRQTG